MKFDKSYEDLRNRQLQLAKKSTEVMGAFRDMHGKIIKEGKLSVKEKELIALGIAVAIRCEGCILSHLDALKAAGGTIDDVIEAIEVAVLMGGGPSTIYGSLALDIAMDTYDK